MEKENLCELCKKDPARFKVRDKKTGEIFEICPFCEDSAGDIELVEDLRKESKDEFTYGRLHLVKRTKKDFECRNGHLIETGSSCYTQSKKKEGMPFPFSTRVCINCGEELIKIGTEVIK